MNVRHPVALLIYVVKWLIVTIPLGGLVGSACALFLASLEWATRQQAAQPWLLYLLPVAGVGIAALYRAWGESVEGGNNLILDAIHEPGGGVPLRMTPLILITTVVTHAFGGSAGREGTAVQMGGSLAAALAERVPRITPAERSCLLMAGIAAGFGGVFGTPVAGMIFALEVLAIGRLRYTAIFPCLVAAVVSDRTCTAWGIEHTHYVVNGAHAPITLLGNNLSGDLFLLICALFGGLAFGGTSALFAELTHGLQSLFKRLVPHPFARPIVGGLIVIALVQLLGTRDYLGLGVSSDNPQVVTIVSAFQPGGAHSLSWFWKVLFTAITLSAGFKGGEVTPLFFIGATLGHVLALVSGAPIDWFAALGFVAVFAGATNTPLACTIMGVELFGGAFVLHYMAACLMAYLFSGNSGIYLSQRIDTPKLPRGELPDNASLRSMRESHRAPRT